MMNLVIKNEYLKWIMLSLLVGIFAGLTSSVFLYLLKMVTDFRSLNPSIIWLLPLAGLFIGWSYHLYGQEAVKGNNLILDEIHSPKNVVPLRMAPMIFIGTVITHLFGGSAGREGAAVQMSASIADNVGSFFNVNSKDRKILLMIGSGAGFGSAIGAPIAGMIFGMEVLYIGRLRFFAWPQCLIASFTAYYTSLILKTPHTHFSKINIPNFDLKIFWSVVVSGIIFGLVAMIFNRFTHFLEHLFKKKINIPYIIPFIGGIFIIIFYYFEGSYRYAGLGLDVVSEALEKMSSFKDPSFKLFFTSLTVATGFKGGEFVPLIFIGTTLGSALSLFLPSSFSFLGALGFSAVFAGASNTPLACAIMASEIFGFNIFPYALLACYLSYYSSGHSGIYRTQKIHREKYHYIKQIWNK